MRFVIAKYRIANKQLQTPEGISQARWNAMVAQVIRQTKEDNAK